jgi:hypothetical protein
LQSKPAHSSSYSVALPRLRSKWNRFARGKAPYHRPTMTPLRTTAKLHPGLRIERPHRGPTTESRHFPCIALSRVGEVSVHGILKAKGLALILALMLCPCLPSDSASELQKAQDLIAKRSLAEAVTALRQVVQNDRSNLDAHLLLATEISCRGFKLTSAFTLRKTTAP